MIFDGKILDSLKSIDLSLQTIFQAAPLNIKEDTEKDKLLVVQKMCIRDSPLVVNSPFGPSTSALITTGTENPA